MGWGGTPKTAQPLCEGPLDLCGRANKGEREGRGGRRDGRKRGGKGKKRKGKGKKWGSLGAQADVHSALYCAQAGHPDADVWSCSLGELTVRGGQMSRGKTLSGFWKGQA